MLIALQITGSSGLLGYRVLATALEAGYMVRAAVRKTAQIDAIKAAPSMQPHLKNVESLIIEDILAEGAYDEALKGVAYVLHVASPSAFPTEESKKDFIQPAIKGTVGILKSAQKNATVKRVVFTSSEVAITPWRGFFAVETGKVSTDKETIEKPTGPYSHYFEAYAASKVHALHATEDFMATNHPSFDVINVMPSFLIGKHELITDPKGITNGTNGAAMGPLFGNKNPYPNPSTTVHINDVAKIEVMALDPKIPGNQNFLVSSGGIEGTNWQDCIEIVKKYFPDAVAKGIFPLGGEQTTKSTKVDSSRTEEVFGFKLQSYEDQVVSVAQHYLDILGKA